MFTLRGNQVDDIGQRIRHRESREKVMTAEAAALLFRDGRTVFRESGIKHPCKIKT